MVMLNCFLQFVWFFFLDVIFREGWSQALFIWVFFQLVELVGIQVVVKVGWMKEGRTEGFKYFCFFFQVQRYIDSYEGYRDVEFSLVVRRFYLSFFFVIFYVLQIGFCVVCGQVEIQEGKRKRGLRLLSLGILRILFYRWFLAFRVIIF